MVALTLLASLAAPAPRAEAQSGPASALGDPSGRTAAPRPRPAVGEPRAVEPQRVPEAPSGSAWTPPPAPAAAPMGDSLSMRLRILDATYGSLAASGPNYLNSVLSLVGGAVVMGIGIALLEVGYPYDDFSPYLMVLGGGSIARVIVTDFILRPNPQPVALQYQQMPMGTRAQSRARLEYGERQLESLAEQSLIARVVDASMNIAIAGGSTLAYLAAKEPAFTLETELEALIFLGPAVTLIGAIISFATSSPAEQRWDAYRQMRDRLEADADDGDEADLAPAYAPGITVSGGIAIDPMGGGFGTLTGAF